MRKTHTIYISGGNAFPCREREFILDAMRRSGAGPVKYGCFGGGCGVCKMKITSGNYQITKKMSRAHISEAEEGVGICLLCCTQALSDLTIEPV